MQLVQSLVVMALFPVLAASNAAAAVATPSNPPATPVRIAAEALPATAAPTPREEAAVQPQATAATPGWSIDTEGGGTLSLLVAVLGVMAVLQTRTRRP